MDKRKKIKRLGKSKLIYDDGRYKKKSISDKIGTWVAIIGFLLMGLYFLLPYLLILEAWFIG